MFEPCFTKYCYLTSSNGNLADYKTWYKALSWCQDHGSWLAVITNNQDNADLATFRQYLSSSVTETSVKRYFFIDGRVYRNAQGNWTVAYANTQPLRGLYLSCSYHSLIKLELVTYDSIYCNCDLLKKGLTESVWCSIVPLTTFTFNNLFIMWPGSFNKICIQFDDILLKNFPVSLKLDKIKFFILSLLVKTSGVSLYRL